MPSDQGRNSRAFWWKRACQRALPATGPNKQAGSVCWRQCRSAVLVFYTQPLQYYTYLCVTYLSRWTCWIAAPEPGGLVLTRLDAQAAVARGRARVGGHAGAGHPPLRLEHRLDHVLAARAQAQAHRVARAPAEQAQLLQPGHHRLARLQERPPCSVLPRLCAERAQVRLHCAARACMIEGQLLMPGHYRFASGAAQAAPSMLPCRYSSALTSDIMGSRCSDDVAKCGSCSNSKDV